MLSLVEYFATDLLVLSGDGVGNILVFKSRDQHALSKGIYVVERPE